MGFPAGWKVSSPFRTSFVSPSFAPRRTALPWRKWLHSSSSSDLSFLVSTGCLCSLSVFPDCPVENPLYLSQLLLSGLKVMTHGPLPELKPLLSLPEVIPDTCWHSKESRQQQRRRSACWRTLSPVITVPLKAGPRQRRNCTFPLQTVSYDFPSHQYRRSFLTTDSLKP